ncbi:HNH endonuclease [Promineifilum sp.]|uniref:HNH endonuclease n=1 Tax=Promineifilum sp. TaxID=2664178 RepID=UPI0035AD9955
MTRITISPPLRRLVSARADERCEYCLLPEAHSTVRHTVDHIRALKHNGPTEPDNLALACTVCNRNKGSDIATIDPETQQLVRLFDPRRDHWSEHFALDGAEIIGLTAIGRGTVAVLQLNEPTRVQHRRLLQERGHYPAS